MDPISTNAQTLASILCCKQPSGIGFEPAVPIYGNRNVCWFSEVLDHASQETCENTEGNPHVRDLRDRYISSLNEADSKRADETFRSFVKELVELSHASTPADEERLNQSEAPIIRSSSIYDFDSIVGDEIQASLSSNRAPLMRIDHLDVSDNNLDDSQLEGQLKRSVPDFSKLKSVNVSGNKLSDTILCRLMDQFTDSGARLETLNVAENSRVTHRFISYLSTRVRSLQLGGLRSLSIAGIHLAGPRLADLLNNLSTSTTPKLESLNLSNTQLGMFDDIGCDALSFTLSQIRQLSSLDISRNFLRAKHLTTIGEALALMDSIRSLNVSHNSGGVSSKLPAIGALCSLLGSVASLESVQLASCNMNDEIAFILADSLSEHPRIKHIDLNGNTSIGLFGVQSILRLVFFRDGAVESINLNHSCGPITKRLFDFVDPSGRYVLDMKKPVDKAVARQCLHAWERSGQGFGNTFKELSLDGKPFGQPVKDDENVWQLPDEGILRFTASYITHSLDKEPVITAGMLRKFIHGVYGRILSVDIKQALIQSIQNSFVFDCDVSELVSFHGNSAHLKQFILQGILPRVKRPLRVISKVNADLEKLKRPFRYRPIVDEIEFNPRNPTGHYRLNLGHPVHRSVALALVDIAKVEYDAFKSICNYPVMRNTTLNGSSFEFKPSSELPEAGVLEFDFVSPFRLKSEPIGSTPNPHDWNAFILSFVTLFSTDGGESCLKALRSISEQMFITSSQLAELLVKFPEANQFKIEIATILLRRITDYQNLKEMLCRDRLGIPAVLDHDAVKQLERRVGVMSLFNPLKLENTTNDCDLGSDEGRVMAKVILTLLSKEKGSRLVNSRFGETADKAESMLPPKAWYAALPDSGWWSCTYVVDEKNVNHKLRKELAVNLCGFDQRSI